MDNPLAIYLADHRAGSVMPGGCLETGIGALGFGPIRNFEPCHSLNCGGSLNLRFGEFATGN
jgi:hypothetical protein